MSNHENEQNKQKIYMISGMSATMAKVKLKSRL